MKSSNNDLVLKYDKILLDMGRRVVLVDNKFVCLRNKEFSLLEYFMRNAGRVLSRTEILEDVWDRNICCPTNTVDVHVSKLRKKLGAHLSSGFIRTVHCVGYIFQLSY